MIKLENEFKPWNGLINVIRQIEMYGLNDPTVLFTLQFVSFPWKQIRRNNRWCQLMQHLLKPEPNYRFLLDILCCNLLIAEHHVCLEKSRSEAKAFFIHLSQAMSIFASWHPWKYMVVQWRNSNGHFWNACKPGCMSQNLSFTLTELGADCCAGSWSRVISKHH